MKTQNWIKTTFGGRKEVTVQEFEVEMRKLPFKYAQQDDICHILQCWAKQGLLRYDSSENKVYFDGEQQQIQQVIPAEIKVEQMSYDKKYIPRKFGDLTDVNILKTGCMTRKNILLIGETGTGKTHAVYSVAKEMGKNVIRVNFDKAATPEDLIGEYKPNGEAGKFVWCDGVLIKAMKEGMIFMGDEINAGTPEIMFYLNSILDDDKKIIIKQHTGEEVKASENFVFIATMNPETYKGVNQLNPALLDRFDIVLFYDYDTSIEKKLGIEDKLIKFAEKVRSSYILGEVSQPVSTRGLLQYMTNKTMFGYKCAKEMLIAKFPMDEKKAIKEVFEMTVEGEENVKH